MRNLCTDRENSIVTIVTKKKTLVAYILCYFFCRMGENIYLYFLFCLKKLQRVTQEFNEWLLVG